MKGGVLTIHEDYFLLTGGIERWLYRVARKHAGAAGPKGFAIPMPTRFEKSGAEGTYRRFKFEMLAIVARNDIPDFDLLLEVGRGSPASAWPADRAGRPARQTARAAAQAAEIGDRLTPDFLAVSPPLSDHTISLVRRDFPGLDVYAIKADYDAWLADDDGRRPNDYQRGYYGFARHYHSRYA